MKILVAADSFKGSLTSREACEAIKRGLLAADKTAQVIIHPLADGGEGTAAAIASLPDARTVRAKTVDPLLRPIEAEYCILGDTAVIEMAAASGLTLLSENELNPKITTTYGTGLLIKDALDKGLRQFIVALGGSATNDGGAGCLSALGARLLDCKGYELAFGGAALTRLETIDLEGFDPRIADASFTAACDVSATLCGENGASKVFAKQKGASPEDILLLEEALEHYGAVLEKAFYSSVFTVSGGGAAGGFGAMLSACCKAKLLPGFTLLSELTALEKRLSACGLIVTGEGKTDASTLLGKLPMGILNLAKKQNIPCVLLSGDIACPTETLTAAGFTRVYKARPDGASVDYAISHAAELLTAQATQILTG